MAYTHFMKYTAAVFAVWVSTAPWIAAQQHDPATHRHMEAAKVESAVPSTPKSIADGATLFNRNCASCHGRTAMGDGPASKQLNPEPSNLADAEWTHGTSD